MLQMITAKCMQVIVNHVVIVDIAVNVRHNIAEEFTTVSCTKTSFEIKNSYEHVARAVFIDKKT